MTVYESRSLFSDYYLQERLTDHDRWAGTVTAAYRRARDIYAGVQRRLDTLNEAQTEEEFIKPVLREVLGFAYDVQVSVQNRGRRNVPDYILFGSEGAKAEAGTLSDESAYYDRAAAVADAKYWRRPLDRQGDAAREDLSNVNPSFQIVNYLIATGVDWGVLTNGARWRLYYAGARSRVDTYFEVDLERMLAEENEDAFRYFYNFFRAGAFVRDPHSNQSFLEAVYEGSVNYGAELQKRLKDLIFERIFIYLATGFLDWRTQGNIDSVDVSQQELDEIYQGTLRLLYRLLFLLHAEARDLLPVNEQDYYDYSLLNLKRDVADRIDRGRALSDVSTDIWNDLESLFTIIDRGDPRLNVPRYNGGLFRRDNPANNFLNRNRVPDYYLAPALELLTRERIPETGRHRFIDYKSLDVEQLGSIYEGLLEFHLRLREDVDAVPPTPVVLINDKGERKATGSYYTPHYIVEYIVENTLGPVLEERAGRFRELMAEIAPKRERVTELGEKLAEREGRTDGVVSRWTNEKHGLEAQLKPLERDAVEALLGIRVCDPAMGSGHFLVEATDWLAEHLIAVLNEFPGDINPVLRRIAGIRERIVGELEAQDISIDREKLKDTNLLKRMVMKRCIYGVDLNPMAVELAKLSLWLDSFTVGAPLSFLDHHLKVGNSLIGARVEEVREALEREGAQYHMFGGPFAGLLTATELMRDVAVRTDATFEEVTQSAETYAAFEEAMLPYKRVLDLWVSRYFGNRHADDFLRLYGNDALEAVVDEDRTLAPQYRESIENAHTLWQAKRFFHWDLEFPEVFIDLNRSDWKESPGFDAIVGNPPYVRVQIMRQTDSDVVEYFSNAYSTASGSYDLYMIVAERAQSLINEKGFVGLILPNKFFTASYGSTLRHLIARNRSLYRLIDFTFGQVFEGVTTYTCLLFLSGHERDSASYAELEKPRSVITDEVELTEVKLDTLSKEPWAFMPAPVREMLDRIAEVSDPLQQVCARSFQGIRTSANDVYVLKDVVETKGIIEGYSNSLQRRVSVEKRLCSPFVAGDQIQRYELLPSESVVLVPYNITGVGVEIIPLEDLQDRYPLTHDYFLENKSVLEAREDGRLKDSDYWHGYIYPKNLEVIRKTKILTRDIIDRVAFALDEEGKVAFVTGYGLILSSEFRYSLEYILAVLNSRFGDFALKQLNTFVRGGYIRIFTQYLDPIPIRRVVFSTHPDKRKELTAKAGRLYERCMEIHDQQCVPDFVEDQLGRERERSDVVHDTLAFLAERMIALHERRQRLEDALDPFKYLDAGVAFAKFPDVFAEEIKFGQRVTDLGAVHHDIDGLRLVPLDTGAWELQVQLKKRDPDAGW